MTVTSYKTVDMYLVFGK